MFVSKAVLVASLIVVLRLLRGRFRHVWPFGLAMTLPTALVVVNNLVLVAHALA